MKYKVTFDNGQVSVYDTKTPLDEFKAQFNTAVAFEVIGGQPVPVIEVPVAVEPVVEVKAKRVRKSG